jgi:hypothetical protein
MPDEMGEELRQSLKDRIPEFDIKKIFFNATHTHTAPVLKEGHYNIPGEGVLQPKAYVQFLIERLSDLVVRAWENRKPGAVSWALAHAVIAQNRRAVYADGQVRMYGKTDAPQFRGLEGYEDHDVNVLFFWSRGKKLIAVAVNVACPAQEDESKSVIDPDFWHEVRLMLRERYSQDLHVLGWTGAAGDLSPHVMYGKRAEERMRQLRGLTRRQEIARRICTAVEEAYDVAQRDIRDNISMVHKIEQIRLPERKVTDGDLANSKAQVKALSGDSRNRRMIVWHEDVIARYDRQKINAHFRVELHVIRIGDVVICTNPFELFTDYGIQIKSRSKALQTFVIQLTGSGGYLPTEKAVRSGGYSAIVESNVVGPEGGQILVDRTVEAIDSICADIR